MAADSIAKLAVIITGDASPLTAEMGRASRAVDSWSAGMQRMQRSGMGMEKIDPLANLSGGRIQVGEMDIAMRRSAASAAFLDRSFRNLNTAALKGRAGIEGLIQIVRLLPPQAQAAIAGMAALAYATYKLAEAGDNLHRRIGFREIDTWAGQWAKAKKEIAETAGILGSPLALAAGEASTAMASMLKVLNEAIMPQWMKDMEAKTLALAEATKKKAAADKLAADNAKKHAEAMKEAAQAAEKERDERAEFIRGEASRAESIKDSVRTPGEELFRTFHELRSMFGAGFIDEKTAMRAGIKAREAFDQASGPRREAQARAGVGAVDKNTMAGFSAVQGGLREIERLEKVQKDQLKEEQNQTAVQKEIRDILHGQTPIVLIGESP